MTEFQVGDQVSVGGTVTAIIGREHPRIQFITPVGTLIGVEQEDLTLVERPRKKLRVGSVWECDGRQRYVHIGKDMLTDWLCSDPPVHRSQTTIDELPNLWREVPVEELEREAQA